MAISTEFVEFLISSPHLKEFLSIMNEWYDLQGEFPTFEPEEGPREWVAGEKHDLMTTGLTVKEIDSLVEGMAEGLVKEKAVAYVKGLLAGIKMGA